MRGWACNMAEMLAEKKKALNRIGPGLSLK